MTPAGRPSPNELLSGRALVGSEVGRKSRVLVGSEGIEEKGMIQSTQPQSYVSHSFSSLPEYSLRSLKSRKTGISDHDW